MKKIEFEIEIPDFGLRKKRNPDVKKTGTGSKKNTVKDAGKFKDVWERYNFIFWPVLSWGIPLALSFFGIFELSFSEILISGYLLFALFWGLESRLSAGLALFFLVLCPVFLQLGKSTLAEDFAVYAFYFLCITILQEIREMALESWKGKEVMRLVKFPPKADQPMAEKVYKVRKVEKVHKVGSWKVFVRGIFLWLGDYLPAFVSVGVIFFIMNYHFEMEIDPVILWIFAVVFLASLVSKIYFRIFAGGRKKV